MNCTQCNTPLPLDGRFCRTCGLPIPATTNGVAMTQPALSYQTAPNNDAPRQPSAPQWGTLPQTVPSPNYAATQPVSPPLFVPGPGTEKARTLEAVKAPARPPKQRRRSHWLLKSLISLFLTLIILAVAGWFLLLRPYLNNLAKQQIDQTLTSLVNQIPDAVAILPAETVPVTEQAVNNLIVLNTSPADTVKNIHITITADKLQLDFQVYGYSTTITGVPQVNNQNQLIITNVQISGVASFILSSDDLTTLVNKQLAAAQTKLKHPILKSQLKNQELDLTLGPPHL